jgi:hypothetical protein
MRNSGLDPRQGKSLLAKTAAEHLQENAALMGIEPHEMDLMSPLAYLPMGQELRAILETSERPTELPDEPVESVALVTGGLWCRSCEYLEDPADVTENGCFACGCDYLTHQRVHVVPA